MLLDVVSQVGFYFNSLSLFKLVMLLSNPDCGAPNPECGDSDFMDQASS